MNWKTKKIITDLSPATGCAVGCVCDAEVANDNGKYSSKTLLGTSCKAPCMSGLCDDTVMTTVVLFVEPLKFRQFIRDYKSV